MVTRTFVTVAVSISLIGLVAVNSLSCKPFPVIESPTPTATPGYSSTGPLSITELANLVIRHFPDGTVLQTGENIRVTAYAVARAESGGDPGAVWDDGQSIGI